MVRNSPKSSIEKIIPSLSKATLWKVDVSALVQFGLVNNSVAEGIGRSKYFGSFFKQHYIESLFVVLPAYFGLATF
ncbi:hypothetical protein PAXRUDRAFT_297230 [Paxillus rubicundulus Ve08.2h10]|uniref:Uncharacterized protein n=1 Tax=Paxillus rubicundulus Ve08.2h10 TaxID=930991 RepID=A0A0D0EAG0_9AGAM|nr:hypothetical protein PAXRUDRAFT_297230 [Paxillus rubicundulus Ve08.2h10]